MRLTRLRVPINLWLIGAVLLVGALMIWLSLARYKAYNTRAFDLGAMSQSIWSVTQGRPLIFTVQGITFSRLARHVEFFYFLLAPLYALFPTPATLLTFQATLFALGAFPLYRFALRRLENRWAAMAIALVYLFYPVAQTAVLFDFHGDTLAMPLLLFAINDLDKKAWRRYAVWIALALSCKFYVAVAVAAMGVVLWQQGHRRVGIMTAAAAVLWGGIAFFGIRPLFAPVGAEAVQVKATALSYFRLYFSQMNLSSTGMLRLSNAVIVYVPVLLFAWRAPLWLLPATAVILPALLSSGPGPSFDYRFHHYALGVPFLMAALVYGAVAFRRDTKHSWPLRIGSVLGLTLLTNALLVSTPLNFRYYNPAPGSGMGLDSLSGYTATARDQFKDEWLAPLQAKNDGVAADRLLGSRLTNRDILYLMPPEFKPHEALLPDTKWVVLDALFDFALATPEQEVSEDGVTTTHETIRWLLKNPRWRLQEMADGLLLFTRADTGLAQEVEMMPVGETPSFQATFGDEIGLLNATIMPMGERRFQLQYDWMALDQLRPYLAVSRPVGLAQARIVHLPTLALAPPQTWPSNQIVRETFEITLPKDASPGRYPLVVGWYDTGNLFAAATDERSRLGEEVQIGWLDIR